ncbi:GGDEF domain-containing protein [Petrocella sp. FN5]|uniref:GGDEF domain-containing protein n=1 Tax=Petrocella sp. FN5 TaxID=3032002 RepID=UPI0023DBF203|nr:diguanylate cyclase [Petrocella sp. FN5]MDF1616098.1 diguanylate cyclase [Petrocella sp. FN5]
MLVEPIYTLTVNGNFIGTLIAIVMVGAFSLLSILYYIYIDKDRLLIYLISYFTFVFISLLTSNYFLLIQISEPSLVDKSLYTTLILFLDYGILFSILCGTMYIFQRKNLWLSFLYFILVPAFYSLSLYNYRFMLPLFITYLSLVVLYCFYLTLYEIIHRFLNKYILYLAFYFSLLIYYALVYWIIYDHGFLRSFDWIFSLILVFMSIFIFLVRYKKVILEKDYLYEKLTHDSLTHLYSRSYFLKSLNHIEKGTLLFIDVNYFKTVNDQYGHLIGDQLLVDFSDYLLEGNPINFLPCRYGGDEFVLLLYDESITSLQIHDFLDALFAKFKMILMQNNITDPSIGLSIGIAAFHDYCGHDALIHADFSMYEAKKDGNYKIVVHDEGMVGW